jgi:DHA2 family multidrug resistance protein
MLRDDIDGTTRYLQTHGFSHADAVTAATAHYYDLLYAQTRMLAFMDCFHLLAVLTLVAAPLVLFTAKFKAGGEAPAGH